MRGRVHCNCQAAVGTRVTDANQATTDSGETPHHAAVLGGVLLVMQYLVLYGASLVTETFQGHTPGQIAAQLNKPELTKWLNAASSWS